MKFLDEEHSYTFRSDIQDNIDRGSRDLFDAVSAFAASLIQPVRHSLSSFSLFSIHSV
jgi:hypothetical protein